MNGLKYIRTQCNFSLSELADRLNVSRQIISAWENGKKEIPDARKIQMAEFFGIDKSFFDDITVEQKKVLLGKAMFRYVESGMETYRYKPNMQEKSHTAYFIPEREMSLDEEFVELQRIQKQLIERINHIISGPEQVKLRDQMSYIIRGTEVFSKTADAMEACFSKEPQLKMQYFFGMVEVLQALNIAIVGTDDENLQYEDSVHDTQVKELVSMMKQIFELKAETVKIPEKSTLVVGSSHGKSTMSMEEKINKAEEEYSNFDNPKDMKMFAVNLDYLQ